MRELHLFGEKRLSPRRHLVYLLLYAALTLACVGLDQLTKAIVVANLELGESIPLWPGVFHFTRIGNTGAAFGMLSQHRWVFLVVSAVAIVALSVYLVLDRTVPLPVGIAFSLMVGGGVGNMIDRLTTGVVVDFLDFRLINFAVFNVADSFVCIGAALMAVYLLVIALREVRKKSADPTGKDGTP